VSETEFIQKYYPKFRRVDSGVTRGLSQVGGGRAWLGGPLTVTMR